MSEETAAPAAPKAPKAPQSITRTLVSGKEQMMFIGIIRKDGTVGTYVTHRILKDDGKLEKSKRGATSEHASVADAHTAIAAGIAIAVKKGWQERKGGPPSGGFRARPDAFSIDNLPSPSKSK